MGDDSRRTPPRLLGMSKQQLGELLGIDQPTSPSVVVLPRTKPFELRLVRDSEGPQCWWMTQPDPTVKLKLAS